MLQDQHMLKNPHYESPPLLRRVLTSEGAFPACLALNFILSAVWMLPANRPVTPGCVAGCDQVPVRKRQLQSNCIRAAIHQRNGHKFAAAFSALVAFSLSCSTCDVKCCAPSLMEITPQCDKIQSWRFRVPGKVPQMQSPSPVGAMVEPDTVSTMAPGVVPVSGFLTTRAVEEFLLRAQGLRKTCLSHAIDPAFAWALSGSWLEATQQLSHGAGSGKASSHASQKQVCSSF